MRGVRSVDVERASDQIDILIERRHLRANAEQRHIEVLWKESTRRERDKRRRENAEAWYGHHEHMRELHSSLAAEHEARARALLGGGGA
jgi:hypothetical protein